MYGVEPYLLRKKDPIERQMHRHCLYVVVAVSLTLMVFGALFADKVLHLTDIPVARAQETGPMTNKEACQDLQKGGFVKGGHMKDVVSLCAKEGVAI